MKAENKSTTSLSASKIEDEFKFDFEGGVDDSDNPEYGEKETLELTTRFQVPLDIDSLVADKRHQFSNMFLHNRNMMASNNHDQSVHKRRALLWEQPYQILVFNLIVFQILI